MALFKNPAKEAQGYVSQIPGQVQPYYQPYIDAGQGAMSTLQNQYSSLLGNYQPLQSQYNQLMNDPGQMLTQMGSGYQASPGYQWQLSQGEDAISNAADAGGMQGTMQEQQQAGQLATNLANQNYQQYLSHVLSLYHLGLHGNQQFFNQGLRGEQGLNQMGYHASNAMAEAIAQSLMAQAGLAGKSSMWSNQRMGGLIGAGIGVGSELLGSML